jgi:hypothetical protein
MAEARNHLKEVYIDLDNVLDLLLKYEANGHQVLEGRQARKLGELAKDVEAILADLALKLIRKDGFK